MAIGNRLWAMGDGRGVIDYGRWGVTASKKKEKSKKLYILLMGNLFKFRHDLFNNLMEKSTDLYVFIKCPLRIIRCKNYLTFKKNILKIKKLKRGLA